MRPPRYTVTIDGEVMGPSELSDWLLEHRGHFVGMTTLRARMEKGETGETLFRKSRQKQQQDNGRTYPQLTRIAVPGWGCK